MADCVRYVIDSNSTGLSFAEEVCPKQLPTLADDGHDPTWIGLEPNEYDDTGPKISLTSRKPIKANRKNSKGKPTDLDATVGFNQDFTQSNTNRLLEGFFFANYQEKPTTFPIRGMSHLVVASAANASSRYTVATGLIQRGFRPGQLVFVSGFVNAANNGLKLISAVTATTLDVGGALVNEAAPADVVITVVGHALGDDDVQVDVTGGIATLTMDAPARADATLTIASAQNAVAAETVTIDGVVYTFRAVAAAPYEVTIGGSRLVTLVNLAATINGGNLLTPDAHPTVTATSNGDGTMDVDARIAGLYGNGIVTAEAMTQGSWDGNTAGGTGYSWLQTGAKVGEWLFLGGDGAGEAFANNVGYGRIGAISDTALVLDKTTWPVEDEAGTGISLRVFVGDFIYDEPDGDDVVRHTYQFERTLGRDADGVQSEYVIGSVANDMTFNIETADKVTIDLGFIAADAETRTGAEGRKAGTHVAAPNEDFYSTSSDVVRIRMSVIDLEDSFPDTLFAYITKGTIKIDNGVTPVKAVKVFGALDMTVGNFTITGDVTALFSSVLGQRAVRNSSDVTLDMIFAADHAGFIYDIPLLGLGNGLANVTMDDPITLPLDVEAGEAETGYTLSYTTFHYLPTAAMPASLPDA